MRDIEKRMDGVTALALALVGGIITWTVIIAFVATFARWVVA